MPTETRWIVPPDGLGEAMLLSGVIKLLNERSGIKYNIVRRTAVTELLAGHPGIDRIDYLPKGAAVLKAAGGADGRVTWQSLSELLGLEPAAQEAPYLPMGGVAEGLAASMVPWRKKNVAIAPGGAAQVKKIGLEKWERLSGKISASGALVVQLGWKGSEKVKHAYSLAGSTTPKEAAQLLKRVDLLITAENFLLHCARHAGTPVIAVGGAGDTEMDEAAGRALQTLGAGSLPEGEK